MVLQYLCMSDALISFIAMESSLVQLRERVQYRWRGKILKCHIMLMMKMGSKKSILEEVS